MTQINYHRADGSVETFVGTTMRMQSVGPSVVEVARLGDSGHGTAIAYLSLAPGERVVMAAFAGDAAR